MLAGLWVVKSWRKGALELHNRLLTAFLFGFVLICALTFFITVNQGLTLRYIFEILTYALLFLIIANNFRERSHIRAVVIVLLASGILVNVYGIFQEYVTLDMTRKYVEQTLQQGKEGSISGVQIGTGVLHRLETPRIFSTFLHPNAYALYLAMLGALTIGWIWGMSESIIEFGRKTLRRLRGRADESNGLLAVCRGVGGAVLLLLLLASCLLIPYCLWLTYSRGGMLSASVVVLLFVFLKFSRRKLPKEALAVAVAVVALGVILHAHNAFSADTIKVKHISFLGRLKDSQTVEQRLSYWKTTLDMIRDNPWFGVGWGAYESAYPRYMILGGYPVKLAHNNYLQVWAETGIAGLNLFLGIWLIFLYTFWRKIRSGIPGELRGLAFGLGAGIIAFLVNSLTDFALYLPSLVWFVFAFLGLLAAIPSDESEKDTFRVPLKVPVAVVLVVLLAGFVTVLYRSFLGLSLYHEVEEERNMAFPNEFTQERGFKSDPQLQYRVLKRSVPRLKESISYFPLDAEPYHLLGDTYLKLASIEQAPYLVPNAITCLKRAADLNRMSPYIPQLLAMAYWTEGSTTKEFDYYEEALKAEKKASENFPVNPAFHKKLEEIYTALGQPDEAQKEAALAKELAKHYHEF